MLLEGNEYIFIMTKTATFDEATEICNQMNMSKIFEPRTEEEFDTLVDYAKSLGFNSKLELVQELEKQVLPCVFKVRYRKLLPFDNGRIAE